MGGFRKEPSLLNMIPTLFDLVCDWLVVNRPGDWKLIDGYTFQLNDDPIFDSFSVYDDKIASHNGVVLMAADPAFFDKLNIEIGKLKHNNLRFNKQTMGYRGHVLLEAGYIYAPYIPLIEP